EGPHRPTVAPDGSGSSLAPVVGSDEPSPTLRSPLATRWRPLRGPLPRSTTCSTKAVRTRSPFQPTSRSPLHCGARALGQRLGVHVAEDQRALGEPVGVESVGLAGMLGRNGSGSSRSPAVHRVPTASGP